MAIFWTAAEMLRWLGQGHTADVLMSCVENVIENGIRTTDLGGSNGIVEVIDAVCKEIEWVLGSPRECMT